jgi:hypothetical protein
VSATPDIIEQIRTAGGRIMMIEDRLKVRAPLPLPDKLVAELRLHKAEILAFLQDGKAAWTPEDWQAFFDERAGIAEHDGGLSRADAQARAYECCVAEWLIRNPASSEPGCCAWCGGEDSTHCQVVPFGTGDIGHTWLHSGCWPAWYADRREQAVEGLAGAGITPAGLGNSTTSRASSAP